MTVAVSGLGETVELVERMRQGLARLRRDEASRLEAVIEAAYEAQATPEGEPWAPGVDGETPTLASLRDATTVTPTTGGVQVEIDHHAASYQVFGTPTLPARSPLPITADGQPDESPFWTELSGRVRAALSGERRIR